MCSTIDRIKCITDNNTTAIWINPIGTGDALIDLLTEAKIPVNHLTAEELTFLKDKE